MSLFPKPIHSLLGFSFTALRPSITPSCTKLGYTTPTTTTAAFSTTAICQKRCINRNYRLSALRGTGLGHQKLSVTIADLPMPVYDPKLRTRPETSPTHGLWGFFNVNRSVLATPGEDDSHGRGWHAEELRRKSWTDLHHLWWTCVRERNRLRTEEHTRHRIKSGFGGFEGQEREKAVVKTMRTIRSVLVERWYAWNDAYDLAQSDAAIKLYEDENGKLKVTHTPMEDADDFDYEGLDPETREALLLEQETARKNAVASQA